VVEKLPVFSAFSPTLLGDQGSAPAWGFPADMGGPVTAIIAGPGR
jgi:hypothetical protein